MRPTPVPIAPPPGVVLTEAGKVVAGRWIARDKICSVRGKPQKIGGFIRQGSFVTLGTPRACHAWRDNSANQFFSIGTYQRLYAYDSGWAQNDITPLRTTGTLTNPFSTGAGSSIVAVTHNLHGLSPGDTIVYTSVGSGVGGITAAQLTRTFAVATVSDANTYSFDCGVVAASTAGPRGRERLLPVLHRGRLGIRHLRHRLERRRLRHRHLGLAALGLDHHHRAADMVARPFRPDPAGELQRR